MSDSVVAVKLNRVGTRVRLQASVSQLIINYYYL